MCRQIIRCDERYIVPKLFHCCTFMLGTPTMANSVLFASPSSRCALPIPDKSIPVIKSGVSNITAFISIWVRLPCSAPSSGHRLELVERHHEDPALVLAVEWLNIT